MRRGAEVMRLDARRDVGPGMTWETQFRYRAKDRKAIIRLDAIAPTSSLALTATSSLLDAVANVEVLDLGAKRTRVEVRLELKPKTIAARIYVQSMRLARARVERTFSQRVAQLTVEIEDRFKRGLRV